MRSLIGFFALTFAVTWICFIVVAAAIPASSPLGYALVFVGAFAPSLAALSLTVKDEGDAGVRALLGRVLQWRAPLRLYVFAAGYMAAVKLTAALLYRTAAGSWPRFGAEPWYIVLFAVVISTPFQAGEEIGWRGYALPRLASRYGLPAASLLLGLIWAVWHLPQFFIRESDTYRQPFFIFVLQVVALSVALAWLWARSGGSLLLPMLLHSAVNNTKDIVPSATPGGTNTLGLGASPVAWLTVALLWAVALYLLPRMRFERVCRPSARAAV